MPRPRKTVDQHHRDGTYSATRRSGRIREPKFDGEPVKPKGMPKDASQHWDQYVPELIEKGVAKASDTAALVAMCQMWAEYQKALRSRPKDARGEDQRRLKITSYLKEWRTIASRFGLTPSDRAKIEVQAGDDMSNPFEAFLRKRLGEG